MITSTSHARAHPKLLLALVPAAFLTLAGCGTTGGDRALSGAGIGAATGAAATVLTGGSTAAGAVVGGAVGAAVGGLTKKKDIDLGDPIWRR
jgi:hypothetical protein